MFAIIAVVVAVPAMVMFAPAAIAFPVTIPVAIPFISRCNPTCAGVNRAGPVSFMPSIVASHWVPIAFNPNEVRPGPWGVNPYDARGRGRADPNSQ